MDLLLVVVIQTIFKIFFNTDSCAFFLIFSPEFVTLNIQVEDEKRSFLSPF